MIPVPGKSAVAEPKKETDVSKASPSGPNPTDMLPAQMLKDAGVNDDEPKDIATDDAQDDPDTTADADSDEPETADAGSDDKKEDDSQTAGTKVTPPAGLPISSAQNPGTAAVPGLPPPPLPFGGLPTANTVPPLAIPSPTAPAGATATTDLIGPNMPIDLDLLAGPDEKKDLKSWETTLAPARVYPKTKFNYKRVVLPASIYRTQYNGQNRHLPKRLAREDLDKAFLIAVAKNDINGTRALINSGRNVNQMNAYGDSALIVAVRAGAYDTARLLLARGANPYFYGQGGKTAFHYARQQGNNDFAKMLLKTNG